MLAGFLVLVLLWFTPLTSFAQVPSPDTGSASGTVSDSWNGKGLSGVTITVRGFTFATQTDPLGNYKLSGIPPGNHVLQFTKGGYVKMLVENVRVAAGQTTRADVQLKPDFFLMETYEVMAEPFEEQRVEILETRQKTSVLMEALGSEQLGRLGVNDAAEALTKVTGASLLDGKFAVIRGLSDRYTSSTLAGAEIPSADPYRKSAQLDLFPSSMIERVEVNKTFTPDQPGGFTGGSINIVPKSMPEKFFFKMSAGSSYNMQTSTQNMITSPGGGLDWAGTDDGTRAIPEPLANPNATIPTSLQAQLNPASRALLNSLTKSFTLKEMGPTLDKAPLNQSFSFANGDKWKIGDRELGYYATLSYDRKFSSYNEGEFQRHIPLGLNRYDPKIIAQQSKGADEVAWGAAVGIGYKPTEEHEFTFTFLNTQTGENNAYRITGFNRADFSSVYEATTLQYTERDLQSFLFRGKHLLAIDKEVKLDWQVAHTTTTQDDPDLRVIAGFHSPGVTFFDNAAYPQNPSRYWRYLEEGNLNYRVDMTVPFLTWADNEGTLKFGLNMSASEREFSQTGFAYISDIGYVPWSLDGDFVDLVPIMESTLSSANHSSFYIRRELSNDYTGRQEIKAGYGMVELPLHERFKLIGGARLEATMIDLESKGGILFTSQARASINQADPLPALGAVYNPITNVNLRLHYSETIARPTYREIAQVATFDYIGGELLVGNPNLKISAIKNYDFRAEWFPSPGNILAVGAFYKSLKDPIELYYITLDQDQVSYQNRESATVFGWEAEARVGLGWFEDHLKDFSIGVNYAWIESDTALSPTELGNKRRIDPGTSSNRPLYDQSPSILNVDFSYDNQRLGSSFTLAFNMTGSRLAIVNPLGEDIYEHPGDSLDLSFTQRISKNWKLKFSAKNLLDPLFEKSYGKDKLLPYSSYTRGRQFGLALSCSF